MKDSATDDNFLLTIIVPLYNEEDNIARLVKELIDFCTFSTSKVKVLFVNDGSTDKSGRLLEELAAPHQNFSFIHLRNNSGLSTALKAGIDNVETVFAGYIDADLQTSPFDFSLLLTYAADYDLVTGIRNNRQDGFIKRLTSKVGNAIRNMVTQDGISDAGCPLKIFRTDTFRKIPFFKGMHRFLPALFLLVGGKVKQIPVRHFKRTAGKSKYHLYNRLFTTTYDLMAFRWIRSRYIRYELTGKK